MIALVNTRSKRQKMKEHAQIPFFIFGLLFGWLGVFKGCPEGAPSGKMKLAMTNVRLTFQSCLVSLKLNN